MPAASAYMEEENIYNLIPRPQEVVAKAPMYRSKVRYSKVSANMVHRDTDMSGLCLQLPKTARTRNR